MVSSVLSAPGTGAGLVPAPLRALGLDVVGIGREHFLGGVGGEVRSAHNQTMPFSEQHVHARLGAVVPHIYNH